MKKDAIKLTIFTPTYNRAELLKRGYDALCRQTNKKFIWMIVDDGSTDNTAQTVEEWTGIDKGFEIIYIKKENGGLHTGYNVAIENANTELLMCIDSDDYVTDDCVEKILYFWERNGSDDVAGIVALDAYTDGRIIGDKLPNQKKVNLIDLLTGKYPINNGDRTNIVRTELYKKVAPMKSFPGEKNFNPHYMHLEISRDYDFLVMNEVVRYVEYQENGMSNSMYRQYYNSPNSFAATRILYLSFKNTSFKFKLKHSIHYVSSCILANKTKVMFKNTPKPGYCFLALPGGWLLSKIIKKKAVV